MDIRDRFAMFVEDPEMQATSLIRDQCHQIPTVGLDFTPPPSAGVCPHPITSSTDGTQGGPGASLLMLLLLSRVEPACGECWLWASVRSQPLGELPSLLVRVSGGFPKPGSGFSWLQASGVGAVREPPPKHSRWLRTSQRETTAVKGGDGKAQ